MAPRALVSSPAFPGGGGEDASGPAIARPRAEADTPEARTLGKRAVSPMGSTAEVVQKHHAEAPALVPRKALKRGAASARAGPKEPVAQGEVAEAATKRSGEDAPTSLEAEARESDEDEAPSAAGAAEGEAKAPRTSEAEATEAGASRTTEAEVAEAGAPGTTKAEVAEAGVGAAEPAA
ncbi:uncharacterized protein [Miscanthus floridulus]|uniref:uncharacterized protein n=1 Tax=Miscanthus floridulus TaxID=154761 RepID=UPI0034578859